MCRQDANVLRVFRQVLGVPKSSPRRMNEVEEAVERRIIRGFRWPAASPQSSETVTIRTVHNLRVPMRDGVELAADLICADGALGRASPAILIRTPYDKTNQRSWSAEFYRKLVENGYVVIVVDVRGRFNSGGKFKPYFNEAIDGYDTIEWIARQEWCDGNVGMHGTSYVGQTQWYAASEAPPHLRAIVPIVSPPGSLWRNEPIFNGALLISFGEWAVGMGDRSWQVTDFSEIWSQQQEYFEAIPSSCLPEMAGASIDWWREWLEHPTYDGFWAAGSYERYERMAVPALSITGWWDMNFPGSPLNFERMRDQGLTESARRGQRLVIGPWAHRVNKTTTLSGLDFGPSAVVSLDDYILQFYDHWLKGKQNQLSKESLVRVFVAGANEWWAMDDWPLVTTEYTSLYLRAPQNDDARSDGQLSWSPPTSAEEADSYVYDPRESPRMLWRLEAGPVDDRAIRGCEGVLCYTSEVLTAPLDVVGWVTMRLYASSSARDTDWHVRLVDLYPDGSARFLTRGVLRARYRDSLASPRLLEPHEPTLFEFSMDATGNRFLPGHRIGIEVMSSWFTQYDRNLNGGTANPFQETEPIVAHQRVFHQPGLESCVILPIIPSQH
ncbi:CocE/NonD family hydrolase [Mesorhizobium opportunistum]|nr:CocE/NonD family hydrolase [Mesorhizobium opportunistum]